MAASREPRCVCVFVTPFLFGAMVAGCHTPESDAWGRSPPDVEERPRWGV
jgi:hypothetical protein